MVKDILINAGFVEGKTFTETRFLKAPRSTYAIYMDSFTSRGADNLNMIKEHDYTIELYSYKADPTAEAKIEATLDARGIGYDKQERFYIQDEQLFQVIYEFSYLEK